MVHFYNSVWRGLSNAELPFYHKFEVNSPYMPQNDCNAINPKFNIAKLDGNLFIVLYVIISIKGVHRFVKTQLQLQLLSAMHLGSNVELYFVGISKPRSCHRSSRRQINACVLHLGQIIRYRRLNACINNVDEVIKDDRAHIQ